MNNLIEILETIKVILKAGRGESSEFLQAHNVYLERLADSSEDQLEEAKEYIQENKAELILSGMNIGNVFTEIKEEIEQRV